MDLKILQKHFFIFVCVKWDFEMCYSVLDPLHIGKLQIHQNVWNVVDFLLISTKCMVETAST